MFFKSRVLYTIETQRSNAQKIYTDLNSKGLISSFFKISTDNGPPDMQSLLLFLESLPSGTIFSKSVMLDLKEPTSNFISLPFFSSHIKIPVKPGEYVWIFRNTNEKASSSLYNITSYWLSRVHALNHTEDVNYTHNDRDFAVDLKSILDSKNTKVEDFSSRDKLDIKNIKKIGKNSIVKPTNQLGETTFELSSNEIELIKDAKSNYPNKCIPVIASSADDLVLQGSNNTLLKLTTSDYSNSSYKKNKDGKGEVSISAGIGTFANNSYFKVVGSFFNNQAETSKLKTFKAYFPSHPNKSVKLICDGQEENFKNPNLFSVFNDEIIPENINEGAFNIVEDASKISVSELGNSESLFLKRYSSFYNIDVESDTSLKSKKTNSSLLDESKEFETFYYNRKRSSILPSMRKPSVDISSSNINLYSRAEGDGIKIIKEYHNNLFNKKLNSIIRINNEGDIFLDSNRIFIGNGEYHKIKSSFIEKNMLNQTGENNEYNGSLVILGESTNSQQLVLGNQLKEFLREILDVNREDMHQTKLLFENTRDTIFSNNDNLIKELNTTFTKLQQNLKEGNTKSKGFVSAFPPQTLSGVQVAQSVNQLYLDITNVVNELKNSISAFEEKFKTTQDTLAKKINEKNMKRDEELSLRLESIEDNIDKILSKISKTS